MTVFRAMHIVFILSLLGYLFSLKCVTGYVRKARKSGAVPANHNAALDSLRDAVQAASGWCARYAFVELLIYIGMWLFCLSPMQSTALEQLCNLGYLCLLGAMLSLLASLWLNSALRGETSSRAFFSTARRLPARLSFIGFLIVILQAFLQY